MSGVGHLMSDNRFRGPRLNSNPNIRREQRSSFTFALASISRSIGRFVVDRLVVAIFPATSVRLASRILTNKDLVRRLPETSIVAHWQALGIGGEAGLEDPTANDAQEAYAQEGEDLIISRIFGSKTDGFYVDIGAHHPVRHSNTYLLYRRGWRGINIDATPGSMDLFRQLRPRDTNIECLVASDPSPRSFYTLTESALNTASQTLARQRSAEDPNYQVTDAVTLRPRTLASLLDEYLPAGQGIDVMSVDVEGLDYDVLRSNDWARYRPTYLLAELLGTDFEELQNHEIVRFLRDNGYRPISKLYNTVIFR